MGKGSNVAKANRARADAAKRAAAEGSGGGGAAGIAERRGTFGPKCKICLQEFPVISSRAQLQQHVTAKHDKLGFDGCFPGFVDA